MLIFLMKLSVRRDRFEKYPFFIFNERYNMNVSVEIDDKNFLVRVKFLFWVAIYGQETFFLYCKQNIFKT